MKKIIFAALLLLLCSACVSRSTYETKVISEENQTKTVSDKKLVWFWDKDY